LFKDFVVSVGTFNPGKDISVGEEVEAIPSFLLRVSASLTTNNRDVVGMSLI
jgi:hypothetical protein